MDNILIFIVKWFIILPIYIGFIIAPIYLFGAFIYGIFDEFRRMSKLGLTSKHSR